VVGWWALGVVVDGDGFGVGVAVTNVSTVLDMIYMCRSPRREVCIGLYTLSVEF